MSNLANMSEDLRKVRALTTKFPAAESIKLHRGQCSRLREKLLKTLEIGMKASRRYPAQYSKVFRELCRLVLRVKTFADDCCYKRESEFVLAAIKVSAHKERFIKYHVELDWCIFLIKLVRDAKGAPVASEKLEEFDWKEKVRLLVEDTRIIVEEDFSDFKDVLRKHVLKPGDHQKICATLLRRLEDESQETNSVVDDGALGVPPVEGKGERIGGGGYGEVYNFIWKKTKFVLKIPLFNFGTLDAEVAILEKCYHPNIVNLILFHKNPDGKQFLMMEKLSMNLLEYLKSIAKGSPLPPLEAVDLILQVCEGMEYLSDTQRVSHRDMKPENILVKLVSGQDVSVLELQVADFGLSKVRAAIEKSSNQTPNVGTTRYIAPELALDPGADKVRGQSLKADMFSFAVTCSCILTGCEPYQGIFGSAIREYVKNGGRPSLPEDCPAELTSLLDECWHPEPSKRPASFFAICEKLKKLKAMLLTSGAHEGDQAGTSSPEIGGITFQPVVRPLRILVLGNANLVKATCMSICGASGHRTEGRIPLKENVSISPPMRLYRVAATDYTNYSDVMSVVEVRNKRWGQDNLKTAWRGDLNHPNDDQTPFPNRSLRLHIVWYVCEKLEELPNALQWKDITRKCNGVPVQILVTRTDGYERILKYKEQFRFDDGQPEKDSILKVDLANAETKDTLWTTCWEVKTRAEIKNAATIIGYIREQLGSSGKVIRVGLTASKSRKFSVDQSKDFIFNFLISYWEIPNSFVEVLKANSREATKFLPFCLQVAATILYREHEHLGSVPAEASAESVLGRAQACAEHYFWRLDLDDCDKMKPGDVHGFLEAVFENGKVPQHLVNGLHRSRSFWKCVERLLGKGHGP